MWLLYSFFCIPYVYVDKLPSLKYLNTAFIGLTSCHPLFKLCGSSPWEVEKAVCQARLLSGRYRVEALSCHWTVWNRDGLCTLPTCWGTEASHQGTVESFLLSCPSLALTRRELQQYTAAKIQGNSVLTAVVYQCLEEDPVQFWLDCSTVPLVISSVQLHREGLLAALFKLTRNYCHGLHKERKKILDEMDISD